jgi:hypothetical protein
MEGGKKEKGPNKGNYFLFLKKKLYMYKKGVQDIYIYIFF